MRWPFSRSGECWKRDGPPLSLTGVGGNWHQVENPAKALFLKPACRRRAFVPGASLR